MIYTTEELLKLWSNSKKRRDFLKLFKEWEMFASTPELDLTYYRYVLPDGAALIVMEHMQESYTGVGYEKKWGVSTQTFLQKGKYFMPSPVNDYAVDDHLKNLKQKMLQEKGGAGDG